MSSETPKTGLAKRMREWMSARKGKKDERRFTVSALCKALEIQPGMTRQKLTTTLFDFAQRGEITGYEIRTSGRPGNKANRRQYIYNHNWKRAKQGKQNQKTFKAMYVSTSFAVTDIQRLTGVAERDWIDRIIRQLKKGGYIQQIARRHCAHGAGAENIYHIANRDRFKLELMKGNQNG